MSVRTEQGKPLSGMTNEKWQIQFDKLKKEVRQHNTRKSMATKPNMPLVDLKNYNENVNEIYYPKYINAVLKTIRSGKKDYCYYVYQIADLLKYEHDRLATKWLSEFECFEVWLEPKR